MIEQLLIIQAHTSVALLAFCTGLLVFWLPKGTDNHRMLGRVFVLALGLVAFSALFITAITPGQYSVIHVLIPITGLSLISGVRSIRRYKQTRQPSDLWSHKISMISVFVGALVVAGGFTLLPGRYLHQVLFG